MEYPARRNEKTAEEQSMREHSENTAAMCSQTMSQIGLSSLGKITGIIHDSGKLTREFVEYLRNGDRSARGSVVHSVVGAEYIYHKFYLTAKDGICKSTAQLIINAVYAHHGRLYDCIDTQSQNVFSHKMEEHSECGYEKIMRVFFREIISEEDLEALFYDAVKEIRDLFKRLNYYRIGMIQRLLYSALIDADRYDAYCFEAGVEFKCSGLPDWDRAQENMENKANSFKPDTPINKLRCDISERCLAAANCTGGIYKLSVPTGSGKTLSSLRFALNFARINEKAHIFYVIPYTTIIEQTAKEVKQICGDDIVLEHHSGIVTEEDDDNYRLFTQRWNMQVILTTVVQFMNALYAGKSACARRMNALCNSVIIIDEVQTIPKKTLNLFNEALNFLAEICNTTILLCTATPPELGGLKKHPLRLAQDADIVPYSDEMTRVFRRTNIVNLYTDKGMTLEEIARLAQNQLNEVNSVLIVMNKVSQARAIYDSIDCGCEKIYLSTKKCGAHRLETIEYIKKRTEQLRESGVSDKLIVVSTQLVEAGVDFSFECAIRAATGVDSIAQIAGRCNRNGEYDKICNVFLVNVANEDLSKLTDIRKAKASTNAILSANQDMDLLSADAVKRYYDVHFTVDPTKQDEMDYKLDGGDTIMELLSANKNYAGQYQKMNGGAELPMLCQAFKTAGEEFRVIDNETQPVIVPYGEGRKYIERLTGSEDIREKMDIIRRCSRYSVNLYGWEIKKLEDHALYPVKDIGVWILKNEHYSEEYGIKENPQMSFLGY